MCPQPALQHHSLTNLPFLCPPRLLGLLAIRLALQVTALLQLRREPRTGFAATRRTISRPQTAEKGSQ